MKRKRHSSRQQMYIIVSSGNYKQGCFPHNQDGLNSAKEYLDRLQKENPKDSYSIKEK